MTPLAVIKDLDILLNRSFGMGTRFVVLMVCQLILKAWFRPYIPVPPALVNKSLFLSKHARRQIRQRAMRVLRIVVLKPIGQLLYHRFGIRS